MVYDGESVTKRTLPVNVRFSIVSVIEALGLTVMLTVHVSNTTNGNFCSYAEHCGNIVPENFTKTAFWYFLNFY